MSSAHGSVVCFCRPTFPLLLPPPPPHPGPLFDFLIGFVPNGVRKIVLVYGGCGTVMVAFFVISVIIIPHILLLIADVVFIFFFFFFFNHNNNIVLCCKSLALGW